MCQPELTHMGGMRSDIFRQPCIDIEDDLGCKTRKHLSHIANTEISTKIALEIVGEYFTHQVTGESKTIGQEETSFS